MQIDENKLNQHYSEIMESLAYVSIETATPLVLQDFYFKACRILEIEPIDISAEAVNLMKWADDNSVFKEPEVFFKNAFPDVYHVKKSLNDYQEVVNAMDELLMAIRKFLIQEEIWKGKRRANDKNFICSLLIDLGCCQRESMEKHLWSQFAMMNK